MSSGQYVKTWTIPGQKKPLTIRAEHCFWNGEKSYFINNNQLHHIKGSLLESVKFSRDYQFSHQNIRGLITFRALGITREFSLLINGQKIEGTESRSELPKWLGFAYGALVGVGFIIYMKFFR